MQPQIVCGGRARRRCPRVELEESSCKGFSVPPPVFCLRCAFAGFTVLDFLSQLYKLSMFSRFAAVDVKGLLIQEVRTEIATKDQEAGSWFFYWRRYLQKHDQCHQIRDFCPLRMIMKGCVQNKQKRKGRKARRGRIL